MRKPYSYVFHTPSFAEMVIGGKEADVTVGELYVTDNALYLHGNISTGYGEQDNAFLLRIGKDDMPVLDGLKNKERQALFSDERINALLEKYDGEMVIADHVAFADIGAAIAAYDNDTADHEAQDVQTGGSVARQDSLPVTGLPVLLENYNIGDETGDIVLHDIIQDSDFALLTGTWSVTEHTGIRTCSFAVAVDHTALPALFDEASFAQVLTTRKHDIITSLAEDFVDTQRLARDIKTLLGMSDSAGHVPLLAQLGQEYDNFVPALDNYLNGGHGVDQSIKLAILDQVGIGTDKLALRENLLHSTGDLKEFQQKLSYHMDIEAGNSRILLADIANAAYAGRGTPHEEATVQHTVSHNSGKIFFPAKL